jgi:hypothetical protein
MSKLFDVSEAFNNYFHENEGEGFSLRSERFYEEFGPEAVKMVKWLKEAFNQGAQAMAQDTLSTLGDYGTAVAGVEATRTPSQCFDSARENLNTYYAQVLGK